MAVQNHGAPRHRMKRQKPQAKSTGPYHNVHNMSITRSTLLAFLRRHRYAVQSSTHPTGAPQSAVVGIAVSDDCEIVFDTVGSSRKARNLRRRPEISLVIGGLDVGEERTVQYEGIADEPTGAERTRLVNLYLAVFPDGLERQEWQDLTYFRVVPKWLRYSDFNVEPPQLIELDDVALRGLAYR